MYYVISYIDLSLLSIEVQIITVNVNVKGFLYLSFKESTENSSDCEDE